MEKSLRRRARLGATVAAALGAAGMLVMGIGGAAASASFASGNTGTTYDPLAYNCGNDAPTCGQVGESYGYYNGQNVDLLYSENYYCDTNVSSKAATGCEAGAGPSAVPSATAKDGTSLGNTTHSDPLYIPVPLGLKNPPPTQCVSTATCIDHPPTIDLSRLAGALGVSNASALDNVPVPLHNHVVGTRNNGLPEWWNVVVVADFNPNTSVFTSLTSVAAINNAMKADPNHIVEVPTNVFLMFQVLPGTVPAAQAANLTATAPPGAPIQPAPAANASQVEPYAAIDNLKVDCGGGGANCQNIGLSHDWIQGSDALALYTEPYFCDKSVTSAASTGCEAGAAPKQVPPGVSDPVAPSPTVTNSQIDPLYIPVPLFANPDYTQCPTVIVCIDHPATIDLSRLAPALGVKNAASLDNVPLPSHDHLLTTRNGDQPEWWNVIVIPVTTPAALAKIEATKDYTSTKNLETANFSSGVGPEIATNAYLWFQTIPGSSDATPGPVQTKACSTTLPAGTVTGAAALPDGTGYIETDSKGEVAVFGAATCYGSLKGVTINKPIVGIAADRATGGYWLVASDGGVFGFNAPFRGSTGGVTLNKPIVGIASGTNSNGYYLVASDGGVFAFNEPFRGSTGGIKLNKPVVGIAVDNATGGYWLVASDGGVFAFRAPFLGSTGNITLNKPVVGLAPTSDDSGYRFFASDGGVFSYNAPFYGSTGNVNLASPVIAGLNDNAYDGYWMAAADGGIFTFGPKSMPFYGSAA